MEQIERLARARVPVVQLITTEEARAMELLFEVANRLKSKDAETRVFAWSLASGWSTVSRPKGRLVLAPYETEDADPGTVADFIRGDVAPDGALYIIRDFTTFVDPQEGSPRIRRQVRELVDALRTTRKMVVFVNHEMSFGGELAKDVAFVELPLPDAARLSARLAGFVQYTTQRTETPVLLDDAGKEQLVLAGRGLTRDEFDHALGLAIVEFGQLDKRAINLMMEQKRSIVKRTGGLEYFDSGTSFDSIGGINNMKDWAGRRQLAFGKEGQEFGLPLPKGMLLVGPPGTGKSFFAKSLATFWQMPMLRLDMGSMYGSLVGESEANIRRAIQLAEAMSPCVLMVDEIDKAVGGSDNDGGTSERVTATLLSWMNDKTTPVFIVATANDVSSILAHKPEMLRKGRFDAMFFVDLPDPVERMDIVRIHLKNRGRNPEEFDLNAIADATNGFSGAELEAIVVDGMFAAFEGRRKLESADIISAANQTRPMAITAAERIESLRGWAKNNAYPASIKAPPAPIEPAKADATDTWALPAEGYSGDDN